MMTSLQRRRLIALLLLIVVLWFGRSVWIVWQKNQTAAAGAAAAAGELAALTERRDNLAAKVSELSTPEGEEAVLRQNFPIAKEGEKVIVLVPDEASSGTASSSPWWQAILNPFNN